MNNNLGADYAKVGHSNLTQQASYNNDFNAYGSLFQWGRKPDGHDLINYTDGFSGSAVAANTTSTRVNEPEHGSFITSATHGTTKNRSYFKTAK